MKAWDVVGWTYNADVYCTECEAYTDPTVTGDSPTDYRIDKPHPIFSSDEIPTDWVCTICKAEIG